MVAIFLHSEKNFARDSQEAEFIKAKFGWHFYSVDEILLRVTLPVRSITGGNSFWWHGSSRAEIRFQHKNNISVHTWQQRAHHSITATSITTTNSMDIAASTPSTPLPSPSITQRKRSDSLVVDDTLGPMANTAAAVPTHIRRSQTVYSPLVSSMVQSNTLRDCHQIQSMLTQCQMDSAAYSGAKNRTNGNDNSNEPFVCRTAKKYHAMCLSGERF